MLFASKWHIYDIVLTGSGRRRLLDDGTLIVSKKGESCSGLGSATFSNVDKSGAWASRKILPVFLTLNAGTADSLILPIRRRQSASNPSTLRYWPVLVDHL